MATQSPLYEKIQMTYGFSDHDIQLIRYTLSALKCELSKLLVLGIVFSLAGLFPEYAVMMLTLVPIRRYGGGIHFNHYSSCFLFTALFFVLPVLLNEIVLPHAAQLTVLGLCTVTTLAVGPVTAQNRAPMARNKYQLFRLISAGLLLIWFLLFAFVKVFPYANLCFWVIALQTIQLICAKIVRKGDIYEKAE